ncbi:MAG: transcriptional regulator [Nitrososphaerota archaeon]
MEKDQAIGALIFAGSIIGIIIYIWLIINWTIIVLMITASLGLAVLLGILAWIGWTMARTPPPPPLEVETPTTSTETSESQQKAS